MLPSRSFALLWLTTAWTGALQAITLVAWKDTLGPGPRARAIAWTPDATAVVCLVLATALSVRLGSLARSTAWLVGAMALLLVGMQHTIAPFHAPTPPLAEVLAFYAAGALALVVSARARLHSS